MVQGDEDRSERRRLIERPRLLRLLDKTDSRIVLLVGPAGYGKTTLARQWLMHSAIPTAWYRASAGSTDPAALASGLADAARVVVPNLGTRLEARLLAANAPAADSGELARLLADDLAGWPASAWLVVDDHHVLAGSLGEDLLQDLIAATEMHILVTSRNRPRWANARMFLYGDACEFGEAQLAFTPAETDEALANRGSGESTEIHHVSAGWPAIIGLAALTSGSAPTGAEVPDAVHDFFADEIFNGLPDETQKNLLAVCPSPSVRTDLLNHLFGARSDEMTTRATQAGFLTRGDGGSFELHPLLRAFLLRKLADIDPVRYQATASSIATFLLRERTWDEAASMIAGFGLAHLWEDLIDGALDEYLAKGRLTTLSQWIDDAAGAGVDVPILALARSELDFRRAWYSGSEEAALQAVKRLPPAHQRSSRAWFRAGQAAHFQDNPSRATDHYERALAAASSVEERRQALWGLFNLTAEIESDLAFHYLTEFEHAGPLDQTSRLRVAGARLALAVRTGGIRPPLEDALRLRAIVSSVGDPVARSGFLNALAHGLVLAGRYREAHDVAADELADARSHHLSFVLPHGQLLRAAADLGMRRFESASRELRGLRFDPTDVHVAINTSILQAKIALATGDHAKAYGWVARNWERTPSSAMQGELLAMRALVRACARDGAQGQALAESARRATQALEAVSLADWAGAIASRDLTDDSQPLLRAFDRLETTGSADSFVVAYRGRPEILRAVLDQDPNRWSTMRSILESAHDLDLAPWPFAPRDETPPSALSRREEDVYELVGRGYSNREIARTLFISEATVKVHVRRILKKLGVRSRTEAAVLRATGPDHEGGF